MSAGPGHLSPSRRTQRGPTGCSSTPTVARKPPSLVTAGRRCGHSESNSHDAPEMMTLCMSLNCFRLLDKSSWFSSSLKKIQHCLIMLIWQNVLTPIVSLKSVFSVVYKSQFKLTDYNSSMCERS